jgi:hypothetical protein
MALHLELSGNMTTTELDAVAALIAVLRGNAPPVTLPGHAPASAVGIDADRPKVAVIPAPPTAEVVTTALVDTTEEVVVPETTETPDVDVTGLPWDGRIHASTKTLKADKTWTAKRNVSADLVTSVTAELRANMAAPGAPADGPVFTDPAQAFGTIPKPPVEGPPADVVVIPPPPAEEAAPAAAASDGMAEFARIMRVVVDKQKAGLLDTSIAVSIAKQLGLVDMRGLAQRPDLIPAFEALLP